MNDSLIIGIVAVLAGGVLNGSFVAPMKKLRGWQWEHGWLVYSVTGLVLIPWLVAAVTLPQLAPSLADSTTPALARVLLFGFGWGVGSVLFGLGVDRMGLALGYGLILGLIAPIGTFLPLVVLYPERLFTRQGAHLLAGVVVVLLGIVILAVAGRLRERASQHLAARAALPAKSFMAGLLVCILSGIFSPMLNFAFVFGEPLRNAALAAGASVGRAADGLWALTLTAGFLPNAGYALYLIIRNRSGNLWSRHTAGNLFWSTLMGVLCYASFLVYGSGASHLGRLGGIVGWPLFMSMSLITSNSLGALTGEWRGAPARALRLSLLGMGILIVAIVIIASGGQA
jgi:L-rhamnose-H+ transport protein